MRRSCKALGVDLIKSVIYFHFYILYLRAKIQFKKIYDSIHQVILNRKGVKW